MADKKQSLRDTKLSYALILLANIAGGLHLIPVFLQLLINSSALVYIGSILSTQLKKDQNGQIQSYSKNLEENDSVINMSDAKKFPFVASGFLFGFYLLFKVLPLTVFTTGVDLYFSISIIASTAGLIFELIPFSPSQQKVLYTIKLHKYLQSVLEIKNIEISIGGLISFAISAVPVGFYFVTKNWILNNFLAILFSIMALKSMSLSTIKTGLLMLWGLFIYDIFWVYGTDVMVTVAKNLNIPIKILFPYLSEAGESKHSMVGLGDIVIPGVFVALCLKIDVENYLKKNKAKNFSEIPLTYFHTCFFGYVLGIVETFLVMVLSNHAQPALLFLVPMCTLSVLGMAYYKKEFNEFLNYDADFKLPVEADSSKQKENNKSKDGQENDKAKSS